MKFKLKFCAFLHPMGRRSPTMAGSHGFPRYHCGHTVVFSRKRVARQSVTSYNGEEVDMSRLPVAIAVLVAFLAIIVSNRYYKDTEVAVSTPHGHDVSLNSGPHQERIDKFMKWLSTDYPEASKATIGPLVLEHSGDDQLGFRARYTERVRLFEEVARIPMGRVITEARARDMPISKQIIEQGLKLNFNDTFLVLFALNERAKGDASFWAPYLNIVNFDKDANRNHPLLLGDEDLSALEGFLAGKKLRDYKQKIKADFDTVSKLGDFTWSWDEFLVAKIVVLQHVMSVLEKDPNAPALSLIPLVDMFNHKVTSFKMSNKAVVNWDGPDGGMAITAFENANADDECFRFYGSGPVSVFYAQYGFVHDELISLPSNEAEVHLDFSDTEFEGEFPSGTTVRLARDFTARSTRHAWSVLRMLYGPEEHRYPPSATMARVLIERPLMELRTFDLETEKIIVENLVGFAQKALARFKTTLEDDLLALQDTNTYPLHSTERHLLILRASEKSVLDYYVRFKEHILPLFDAPMDTVLPLRAAKEGPIAEFGSFMNFLGGLKIGESHRQNYAAKMAASHDDGKTHSANEIPTTT